VCPELLTFREREKGQGRGRGEGTRRRVEVWQLLREVEGSLGVFVNLFSGNFSGLLELYNTMDKVAEGLFHSCKNGYLRSKQTPCPQQEIQPQQK
jgi:hypothetical protein